MKHIVFFLLLACTTFGENWRWSQPTGPKPPKPYYKREQVVDFIELLSRVLPPTATIVDAGAYTGYESVLMAKRFPLGRIYSFEPVAQLYKELETYTKNFINISTYPFALGEKREEKVMYLTTEEMWEKGKVSTSNSLFPPKDHVVYSNTIFEGTETVQVTTLDLWAEENGIQKIDMLWLDMQGYELPAMKAAPKILSTVSVILTEVEFVEAYAEQPLYKDVKDWLEEQGFVLVGGTFTFPKDSAQWFGDALFVRKELVSRL